MSPRLRMLHAIQSARVRLRDVAAAQVTQAAQVHEERRQVLGGETSALASVTNRASTELLGARRVLDLEQVAVEVAAQTNAVGQARARVEEARTATVAATRVMQEKERELRRAERLVERQGRTEAKVHARDEQREHDDISAGRWKERE